MSIKTFKKDYNPENALGPYLAELDIPPSLNAPLEERCQYYHRIMDFDRNRGREYYSKNLQKDLAKACVEKGIQGLKKEELEKLENLITFASFNPEGAMFTLLALNPKRVLLFYTKESEEKALPQILDFLNSWERPPEVDQVLYENRDTYEDDQIVSQRVREFVKKHGPDRTAWDITPGPKDFNLVLTWALPPEVTPLYLCHHWKDRRFQPGKEKIRKIFKI
ncbi:MAG: hypothetical protein D6785_02035 [Planctomycetota bacterium]|nr:MAG: hypothetical protein D6785_02035 [Planctomycetota bacterium]